jgi:hypothetical protein
VPDIALAGTIPFPSHSTPGGTAMRLLLISCMAIFVMSGTLHAFPAQPAASTADSLETRLMELLRSNGVEVSGQFFISFEAGKEHGTAFSDFFINRGYINIKTQLLPGIAGRITPDISVDREGDGEGDLELRLKYCYVSAELPDVAFFSEPDVVFGLIARPWLAFEQKVNRYRVQGHMFVESIDIMNSADFGAMASSLLGGKMPERYRKQVSSGYPGRYGSVSIGVFNGGGYHAIERNINKTLEGRLTLRPLPDIIPGLQFSYSGSYGKGNVQEDVDWTMHLGFLSFEHQYAVFTATLYNGVGNSRGSDLTDDGYPMDMKGSSFFLELKPTSYPVSLIGRYDNVEEMLPEESAFFGTVDPDLLNNERIIAGIAYRFTRKSKILVDYERAINNRDAVTYEAVKFNVEYTF